jgi:hypothetical protein
MEAPLMYEPAAQPTEAVGTRAILPPVAPVTLVASAKQGTKLACRLLAAVGMLNVSGRLLLIDAPLQPLNVEPLSAVASIVMDAPLTNEPAAHA